MNTLKEYADMPRAEINGRTYVDKELFIRLLDKKMLEEKKYCESDNERSAVDICRNIVANMLMELPNDSNGTCDKATNDFIDEIPNNKEWQAYEKKDRVQIHIEATGQDTTAKLKLEGIPYTGMVIAILHDISKGLKIFPMFSKVELLGKEIECYCGGNRNLIQIDCKPLEFWYGKTDE